MTDSIDGARYLQLIRGGVAVLNARRQEINDLNVFPIPDEALAGFETVADVVGYLDQLEKA